MEKENTTFIDSWTIDQHTQAIDSSDMEHRIMQSVSKGNSVGYMIMTDLYNIHGSYYLKRIVIDDNPYFP